MKCSRALHQNLAPVRMHWTHFTLALVTREVDKTRLKRVFYYLFDLSIPFYSFLIDNPHNMIYQTSTEATK